jgi:signal transduction histidine kinase
MRSGHELFVVILPPGWNPWWFGSAYTALILLIVWCFHKYRLRQVARQYDARLEERVRECTRTARELNDTLLQSIHGLMLHFHYASEALADNDPARPMLKAALQRADTLIVESRKQVQLLRGELEQGTDSSQDL